MSYYLPSIEDEPLKDNQFDSFKPKNDIISMEIAFVLGGLFLFCTIGFIVVAVFFPELVGIQGAKAREIDAEQRGESPVSNSTPPQDPL